MDVTATVYVAIGMALMHQARGSPAATTEAS
jgi:hypothetical protein